MEMKRKIFAVLFIFLFAAAFTFFAISCDDDPNSEYTVAYTDEKGAEHKIIVKNGGSVSLPALSKRGYVFGGYSNSFGMKCFDENGEPVSGLQVTSDMELFPDFKPNTYTFVYDARLGGFDGGEKIVRCDVNHGAELVGGMPVPVSPVAKYEFDGWFSEDGEIRYSNGADPLNDVIDFDGYPVGENGAEVKLFAVYKIKDCTVTLNFSDNETFPIELDLKYGDSIAEHLAAYGKDNGERYIKKWSCSENGYYPIPDKITDNVSLYAVWQAYSNVTFVLENGRSEVYKIDVTPGELSTLPEDVGIIGYEFQGWFDSELCIGLPVTNVYYGDLTDRYYAKLEKIRYTVSFVADGSSAPGSVSYYYRDNTSLPTLSRSGYCFTGWSETPGCSNGFFNIPADMYGDKILYACWASTYYKKTFRSGTNYRMYRDDSCTDTIDPGFDANALIANGYTKIKVTVSFAMRRYTLIGYNRIFMSIYGTNVIDNYYPSNGWDDYNIEFTVSLSAFASNGGKIPVKWLTRKGDGVGFSPAGDDSIAVGETTYTLTVIK